MDLYSVVTCFRSGDDFKALNFPLHSLSEYHTGDFLEAIEHSYLILLVQWSILTEKTVIFFKAMGNITVAAARH